MKLSAIEFRPSCRVSFERAEVELLMRLSASHYDARCREVGQVGGFLYGLNNRYVLNVPEVVALGDTVSLSFRDIDTLCKILEMAHVARTAENESGDSYSLALRLRGELNDCLQRLNSVAGLYQEP